MRRFLFEFEDLSWFPDIIRRSMLDYLSFILRKLDVYKPILPFIKECLDHSMEKQVIDICSGGGGPIKDIQYQLAKVAGYTVPVTLTDKFPNIDAYEYLKQTSGNSIGYISESVDATNIPAELKGVRTMFSAFHHFDETTARSILADAANKKQPIAIFDGGDKNIFTALGIMIVHPIVFFFFTPFFKPFRWSRLLFTYLIPLIPLCTVWDGVVSITRLYEPKAMAKLVTNIDVPGYIWKYGKARHTKGFRVSYLIGYPSS